MRALVSLHSFCLEEFLLASSVVSVRVPSLKVEAEIQISNVM